jgi:hypothetical protein
MWLTPDGGDEFAGHLACLCVRSLRHACSLALSPVSTGLCVRSLRHACSLAFSPVSIGFWHPDQAHCVTSSEAVRNYLIYADTNTCLLYNSMTDKSEAGITSRKQDNNLPARELERSETHCLEDHIIKKTTCPRRPYVYKMTTYV